MQVVIAAGILPLIAISVWHTILILQYTKQNRPNSISEQAAEGPRLLLIHKFVHVAASMLFVVFATEYLLHRGLYIASIFLMLGATLDVLEVFTLRKGLPGRPTVKDVHQMTSWAMAVAYLLYAIAIGRAVHLPVVYIHSVWLSFLVLLCVAYKRDFKDFWVIQMVYFTYLSVFLLTAYNAVV